MLHFCSKKKRIVSIIVSLAVVLTSGVIPAKYSEAAGNVVVYKGAYGEGNTYFYNNSMSLEGARSIPSTLILEGSGTTQTFTSEEVNQNIAAQYNSQPWIKEVKPDMDVTKQRLGSEYPLQNIVINGDIQLGDYTFANYTGVSQIEIGSDVKKIPSGFLKNGAGSASLTIFVYGEGLQEVAEDAFDSDASCFVLVATDEIKDKFKNFTDMSVYTQAELGVDMGCQYEHFIKVDLTPLRIAISKGKVEYALHESDGLYPEEDLNKLKTAVDAAWARLNDLQLNFTQSKDISATEAVQMTEEINTVLDKLLSNVFNILKGKIQTTESNYTEEDYTVGSWNALQTALTEAKKLTEDSDKAAMNDAISAIDTAVAGLVSVKALNEAIAKVEPKNHYTKASWSESGVAEALTNAKAIAADATQVAVDAATQALTEAAKKLVLKTLLDISTLENTVKAYRSFDEADYTEDTWSEFITAYNMAKAYVASGVYKLPESLTQADIDDLNAEVRGAAKSLVRLSNAEARAELKKLLEEIEAKGYKAEDYSEDDNKKQIWNNFANALEVAKGSVDSETQSISSIKLTINNLKEAEAALSALAAPPVVDKKDAYLEYSGSWTKKAETNNMTGYKPDNSKVTVNTSAGDNNWIQIDGLDLSALSNPTLEVEYNANGDTLQVYTDTDWEKALTNGTESSGKYSVSLDKGITTLIFSHNADKLEYTKIKIYDNKEAVQDPVKEAKEQLAAVVSDAEKLKESDYTAESWAALVEALDAASKLTNDSTLEEVNAAKKKIADAVEGLVKAGNDPTPSTPTPPTQGNDDNKNKNDKDPKQENTALKKGAVFTAGKLKYKVTNAAKGKLAVAVQAPKSKKVKSLTIPATVKAKGAVYKVTAIAPNAFKNCKKLTKVTIGKNITTIGKNAFSQAKVLKKITVKSTNLKKVGKNALKGIHKKAVIKVPKKKLKTYKKLFSKRGQKTVKIKK